LLARARAVTLSNYRETARFVGLDPFEMLGRAGLHPSALNDPENWLPASRILAVLEDSARHSVRDDFSVLLGESRTFGSLGPVSLLLKHESTLGAVMMAMIEYRCLLNELLELSLRVDGPSAIFEWNLVPGLHSSHGVNLLATVAYRILVDGAGFDWQPECMHFRHGAPRQAATFSRVFRCAIEFESGFDGMSFSSGNLDLPNSCADPELALHARRLLQLLPAIRREDTMHERAKAMVPLLLASGVVHAGRLAQLLGISVRTLQRRLAAEGLSFRELLNEVRRDLAVRYLTSSNQGVAGIANALGYSTQASFTRWFTSEFGTSPRRWRRTMQQRDDLFIHRHRDRICDQRSQS
jgi:AraC-like DNA-binding protein